MDRTDQDRAERECLGSGGTPTRWPGFNDRQKVECPKCGVRVPVYLRRYDHQRRPADLIVGDHTIKAATA